MLGGMWFVEKHTDSLLFSYKIKKIIYSGRTKYQKVEILDVEPFGKTLFLDDKIQSAQVDEYIYHEALTHIAMFSHPSPKRVLIMGGGEGATLREVLKHESVKEAYMVDIDEELVNLCKEYLPEWSEGAFENPKSRIYYTDARRFVEETSIIYDVIISDLTEPIEQGPSIKLFTKEFYSILYNKLNSDGIFVAQAGSADPLYPNFAASLVKTLKTIFPIVKIYWTFMFSFQLPWAFVIASKSRDPENISFSSINERFKSIQNQFKYYYPAVQSAVFAIPKYLRNAAEEKGIVIKDDVPFIWRA
ncbi:MAG: polyamine aminopropyltransferase [candidate division WOR-3 bacterium]|nr:polyamine aminopropyltransferase [candidate division WOR-3 bacterium]MCX7947026.1 polyamine aminopropyltransferase [candidate division WOR-3 bacterium]MDW8149933.1 polyamine aminopropyltransferase [candidate division WOR-3 bacterium]